MAAAQSMTANQQLDFSGVSQRIEALHASYSLANPISARFSKRVTI